MKDKPRTETFGLCIKDENLVVKEQNAECQRICGEQIGNRCNQGCVLQFKHEPNDPAASLGVHFLKNLEFPNHSLSADAVVVNDGKSITTLVFDKTEAIAGKLKYLENYRLSPAELTVAELVMLGFDNKKIASRLFLSAATVHTHLNNIYKKIPLGFELRRK